MEKLRIIYVEDNLTDFEMVRAILEEEGMVDEIIRCEKKDEFIRKLAEFKPDIVLSDFSLPVFHGSEAIYIMTTTCPDIPIIMVTGNLSDEIAVDLIKKGAWDYILKESIYRLVPSISAALEKKKMKEERKRALDSLQESETNYRILAESSPYGIIVHSSGKILYNNDAAKKIIFGESEEKQEIIGENLFDYIHPDYKHEVVERIQSLYKGKSFPGPTEVKYLKPDGSEIYVEIAASAIMYKGEPAAQVIFRDIVERKKYEQELVDSKNKAIESDKLKTTFLENLSHEIRTPLNGIIGFASLLKFKDLEEEEKISYINVIEDSGKHLVSIIDDLIEISQIETGQIDLRKETFNLNTLMEELFVFFNNGEKYQDKSILLNLIKGLKSDLALIESDKYRIKQVLLNLLTNAFKFTPEGTIQFGYTIEDGKMIRFYVRDTGVGISPEAMDVIFLRFRQADDSTTRQYGGTGLGLTISKAIVEAMGGQISVISKPDEGSEFSFTIPYHNKSEVIAEDVVHQPVDKQSVDWNGKNLIIAEDEISNFTLLRHVLAKTGVEIFHARTGRMVLEYLEQDRKYDLILLDIKMPEMDGYETIKEIRKRGLRIPVIAQTAYAMHNDAGKILNSGCDNYITKPIRAHELIRAMGQYI